MFATIVSLAMVFPPETSFRPDSSLFEKLNPRNSISTGTVSWFLNITKLFGEAVRPRFWVDNDLHMMSRTYTLGSGTIVL